MGCWLRYWSGYLGDASDGGILRCLFSMPPFWGGGGGVCFWFSSLGFLFFSPLFFLLFAPFAQDGRPRRAPATRGKGLTTCTGSGSLRITASDYREEDPQQHRLTEERIASWHDAWGYGTAIAI